MVAASPMHAMSPTFGQLSPPGIPQLVREPSGKGVGSVDVCAPLHAVSGSEGGSSVNLDRAAIVTEHATIEGAVLERMPVQLNNAVDKGVTDKVQRRSFAANIREARETAGAEQLILAAEQSCGVRDCPFALKGAA